MTAAQPSTQRPVWQWFVVFLVAMAAAIYVVAGLELVDGTAAFVVVLLPMLIGIPMVRNAMANQADRGSVGDPQRRYMKRMAVVTLFYVGGVFLASTFINKGDPVTPVSALIALLPGIGVLGFFWAIGRLIVELKDEFVRMLLVRQSLIATGFSLSIASFWGFLEQYGQVPYVASYWVAILWFAGFGIGAAVNKVQYGTTGECT